MKKLLFIHNRLVCGGAESALFSLLNLLDKTKYQMTVFVLNDGGEWEQKFRDAGIRVIHSYSGLIPGRRIHNYILRKRIDKARRNRGKNLLRIVTKEKFDLVIGYHVPAAFMEVGMEMKASKVRYIHGDARKDIVLKGNVTASALILERQNCIVCVSHHAKQAFEDVTGIFQNVSVCYNPIDSEKIVLCAQEEPEEKLPSKYICSVGRLSHEKGFARLIRIHKRLYDMGLEHALVIVGDGPEKNNLLQLVAELGAQNSVILAGYRDNPYCYIKNSLFTVCSSYAEGLHMASMESLCLGVPVVSAFPTVRELFGEEICGIITENDDDSLEAGMRLMLTSKEVYNNCAAGAKARSVAFTASNMVRNVEQMFDRLMENDKK